MVALVSEPPESFHHGFEARLAWIPYVRRIEARRLGLWVSKSSPRLQNVPVRIMPMIRIFMGMVRFRVRGSIWVRSASICEASSITLCAIFGRVHRRAVRGKRSSVVNAQEKDGKNRWRRWTYGVLELGKRSI